MKTNNNYFNSIVNNSAITSSGDYDASFSKLEPSAWFPITKNERGNFSISIPNEFSKKSNLIYVFKDSKENKLLIGKTGTELNKRINVYLSTFNQYNAGNHSEESEFVKAVTERCHDFALGILYHVNSHEDINQCEDNLIRVKSKTHALYNQRSGGGGGIPRSEETPSPFSFISSPSDPVSPPQYKKIKIDKNGNIRPLFEKNCLKTSLFKENEQGDSTSSKTYFYQFKHIKSGQKYIGVTQRSAETRILEHCYQAEQFSKKSRKYSPSNKGTLFHEALGKNPEQFQVGILPISQADPDEWSPKSRAKRQFCYSSGETEQTLINLKKTLFKEGGLNSNQGGGGPSANHSAIRSFEDKENFFLN